MASMKAKKGNPFEKLIAYNLMLLDYEVQRIDDNTKGIDLIATYSDGTAYTIECKFHKGFSWNKLEKIFEKTVKEAHQKLPESIPLFIFKANQQPVLVMYGNYNIYGKCTFIVSKFEDYFCKEIGGVSHNFKIVTIPKGYKVWKK